MFNEPHRGYVELGSVHSFDYNTELHLREIRECCLIIYTSHFQSPAI